jgi:hypothetical protein
VETEFGASFMKFIDKETLIASIAVRGKETVLGQGAFDRGILAQCPIINVMRAAIQTSWMLEIQRKTFQFVNS